MALSSGPNDSGDRLAGTGLLDLKTAHVQAQRRDTRSLSFGELREFPRSEHYFPIQPLEFPNKRPVLGDPQPDSHFPFCLLGGLDSDEVPASTFKAEGAPHLGFDAVRIRVRLRCWLV